MSHWALPPRLPSRNIPTTRQAEHEFEGLHWSHLSGDSA
jgi:hypothetical protein